MGRRAFLTSATIALCALGWSAGCESDVIVGAFARSGDAGGALPDAGAGGGFFDAGAGGAVPGTGGAPSDAPGCVQATCQGSVYACGDCIDNDGDGLLDMEDPDCWGPCHNAEDTYFGSVPGQNRAPCRQDCYFDADSGSGNDRCEWTHACDPLSVAPDFSPEGDASCAFRPENANQCALEAQQPAECLDYCLPLTPNGCDCFGCCVVPGTGRSIWLGSSTGNAEGTCDRASIDDPTRCRPCTIVPTCFNPCEECELCFEKRTLPPSCGGGDGAPPPVPDCYPDEPPCGLPGLAPCAPDRVCITGCCIEHPR